MTNSKNKLSLTLSLAFIAITAFAPQLSFASPEAELADDVNQIQAAITPDLVESLDGMALQGMPAIYNAIAKKASANPNDYIGNWKYVGAAWWGTDDAVHGRLFGQSDNKYMPLAAEIRIRLNEITEQVHAGFRERMVKNDDQPATISDPKVISESLHPVKALPHGIQIIKDTVWQNKIKNGIWPFPAEDLVINPNYGFVFDCGKFHFSGAPADFLLCQVPRYKNFAYNSETGEFNGEMLHFNELDRSMYMLFVSPTTSPRVETAKPTVVPGAGKHQVDLEIVVQ